MKDLALCNTSINPACAISSPQISESTRQHEVQRVWVYRDGDAARAEADAKVKEAEDATAKAAQVGSHLHLVQFTYPSSCIFMTTTAHHVLIACSDTNLL